MIKSVAVLGAGTMGAQIAAHCANAGIPTLLLDLTRDVANEGLTRSRSLKPDPFFTADAAELITTGGFDRDLSRIRESDWIIEAIVERLDLKQTLLEQVEASRCPGSIATSNTSGISIAELAKGRTDEFRRHWLGTHFFNPPRYLPLVEIIPTPDTDPAVVETISTFAHLRLGKNVVIAKDTPNFIANHIALYGLIRIFDVLASGRYTVEEIDAMTGPALGRPKSATFRTVDVVGLDVLAHVSRNLSERSEGASAAFRLPAFMEEMERRQLIGEKAGHGFYERRKGPSGETEIYALDPASMEYRAPQKPKLGALDATRALEDPRERVPKLFANKDRVGEFLRETLAPTLVYTARVTPEIAHSKDDVDRAMRWGFGWQLGPFELLDAIGIREVLAATPVAPGVPPANGSSPLGAVAIPPLLQQALDAGRNTLRDGPLPPGRPELEILRSAKDRQRVVKRNAAASLVDLGDGVLAVEFHSKMNAIGGDTIQMLNAGVKEATKNFAALVVGTEAPNFSAGANLMLLLLEAQEGNWEEIELMIRAFQNATIGLRYADVPVIVAPAGLALGGGCEVTLHGDRVQVAAEAYIGLVEVGVGLIPAGGGTKEMLIRGVSHLPQPKADPLPFVQRVFETIGFARVSTSGQEARRLGYLRDVDGITMNRDRLLYDAKMLALERVREGYQKPLPPKAIAVGGEGVLAALNLGLHLAWRGGRISDHDVVVGRKLAWVLAGGSLPQSALVSEQYLLDLEREAFLALCGERKTQERIQYTLKTGKTLRN
jgi:3-hydroxyacyl-CoA dehydrogenase